MKQMILMINIYHVRYLYGGPEGQTPQLFRNTTLFWKTLSDNGKDGSRCVCEMFGACVFDSGKM